MNAFKNHGSNSKLFRRAALSSLLAGAAALGVTTATPAAHATTSLAADFAMGLVKSLAGTAVDYGMGYVYPSQTTTANLSTSSLAAIQDAIDDALVAQSLSAYTGEADALVVNVTSYYRGATCDDLGTSLSTVQNTILEDANLLLGKLQTCGYSCASVYSQVGAIYVAFLKEQYEIVKEQNNLGCASNSAGTISNYLSAYQTASRTVLSYLKKNQAIFDAEWSSTVSWKSDTTKYYNWDCTYTFDNNARHGNANFCVTYTPYGGSAETFCPTADLSETSDVDGSQSTGYFSVWGCLDVEGSGNPWASGSGVSTWHYNSDSLAKSQGNAEIFLKNMKASHRDEELGSGFYELEATLQKIANGQFSYCGDGICSIGETGYATNSSGSSVPWCGDCTTSNFAKYSYSGGKTFTTSQATTLLSHDGMTLAWQSDGNLVLKNSSGTTLWATGTSGTGSSLELQGDGNICVYNASGSCIWQTATAHASNGTINPPTAQYLVLMSDGLHVMDNLWHSWWTSPKDWNTYADLEVQMQDNQSAGQATNDVSDWPSTSPRQCWTKGTQEVLLANKLYNLVWETDGNLNVYKIATGTTVWTSDTSASAEYLCNEENGNLTIFDAYGDEAWSTNTGSGGGLDNWDGVGGNLVLAGDQLRVVAASGEPIWTSDNCSGDNNWGCLNGDQVATRAFPSANSTIYLVNSGTQTILSNEYAELDFLSSGALVLYDRTPTFYGGSKLGIWSSGTAGSGIMLVFDPSGDVQIWDGSFKMRWHTSTSDAGGFLGLAGCNFFIGDASTGTASYSTQSACTYGTTSSTRVSAAN